MTFRPVRLKTFSRAVTLLLGLLLGWNTGLATTFIELSLDEMLVKAETAFHGTVSSVQPVQRAGESWTEVTFRIRQSFLADGSDAAESVSLLFLGGTAPDGTQVTVELMPAFTEGDEVLLLAYAGDYYSPVVGFNQGVWWLQPDGEWLDITGRPLGVDPETSALTREGGSAPEQVTAALAAALGAR
jgi:hypothetical protein